MLVHVEFIEAEDLDPKKFDIGLGLFGTLNNSLGGNFIDPMQEIRRIYNQNIYPTYINEGIYDSWNMETYFMYCKSHDLHEVNVSFDGAPAFGVCDQTSDILNKFGKYLHKPDVQYIIEICTITKETKDSSGYWKWENYGEYIGSKTKTTEMLKNELDIDKVYLFKILEVKEKLLDKVS